MPFAAVISATLPTRDDQQVLRAKLNFAGQALFEYQARQAAEAGAAHVVILVPAVTPDLSRAVDRLSADGISVALVRDLVALGREVGPGRDILLVADGAIIGQPFYVAMAAREGAAVLVTEDSSPAAAFERIDANHRWAGLARLTPDMLFSTLDMLGDWDLQSTLVRQAVQASAPRILVSAQSVIDGDVALVENQQGADFLAKNIVSSGRMATAHSGSGLIERYVMFPIAAMVAPSLLRQQLTPEPIQIGAMALAVLGLVSAQLGWFGIALTTFLFALLVAHISSQLGDLARRTMMMDWRVWVAPVIILTGIALIGGSIPALYLSGTLGGVWLALLLAIADVRMRQGGMDLPPPWASCSLGTVLAILLIGHVAGYIHMGLALSMLLALASVANLVFRATKLNK